MRKILSLLLFGVGGFLLVTAVLLLVWVPGKMKVTPLDTNSDNRLTGVAKYQSDDPVRVEAYTRNRVNGDRSSSDVAVFDVRTCMWRDPGNTYDDCPNPKGSAKERAAAITIGEDVFAADRTTGEAIGNYPNLPKGAIPHKGVVNKFPFDTEKKTYKIWDTVLEAPTDAAFRGEETLKGLKVYKFVITLKDRKATITTFKDGTKVKGTYSLVKNLWVDPVTGAIQKHSEHQVRKFPNGKNAMDVTYGFTDASVQNNIDDAKDNGSKLSLLSKAPWIVIALGIIAIVIGFLLWRGSGSKRRRADDDGFDDDGDPLDDLRPRSGRRATD